MKTPSKLRRSGKRGGKNRGYKDLPHEEIRFKRPAALQAQAAGVSGTIRMGGSNYSATARLRTTEARNSTEARLDQCHHGPWRHSAADSHVPHAARELGPAKLHRAPILCHRVPPAAFVVWYFGGLSPGRRRPRCRSTLSLSDS